MSELCQKAGVTRDTVRFYERKGLLPPAARPFEHNAYKDYDEDHLERLRFIKKLQALGFSLQEIEDALTAMDQDALGSGEKTAALRLKLEEVDHKMIELIRLRRMLQEALAYLEQ